MQHVDALSRHPTIVVIENHTIQRIQAAQLKDEALKPLMTLLETEEYNDYYLENGILYKEHQGKKLLVIPKALTNEIIRNAHEPAHFAAKKAKDVISQDYYIPKVDQKVEGYVNYCVRCIE